MLICFPMLLIQELVRESTSLCLVTDAFAASWRCASNGQTELKWPSQAKARKAAQQVLIIFVGERGSPEAVKASSAIEIESVLEVATGS